MDMRMPIMDGITATRESRQKWHVKIPIIVLSAETDTGTQREAMDAGANLYLHKPAKPAAILSALKSLIS